MQQNIYRQDDKPLCASSLPRNPSAAKTHADKRGNRDLICITSMNIVLYIGTYFFYRYLNARRDKVWKTWTNKVSGAC
jgi:hypothetical protein